MQCSHFVLDRVLKLSYIVVHPRPTRGALREASQVSGRGAGLPAGHAAGEQEALGSRVLVQV